MKLCKKTKDFGFDPIEETPLFKEANYPGLCQWFALCDHEATTTRPHPILGDVPICDRCNAKVERLSA